MDAGRTDNLDSILAGFLERRLAGRASDEDVEAILADHPDRAEALRGRLEDLHRLDAIWQDLRVPLDTGLLPPPTGALQTGTRVADFEIQRELGRGGMGTVYLARQESLKRVVALKVIAQAAALSKSTRQRFLREAEAMGALSHPNIVPVYTAGEAGGTFYIAMEYVDGVSLADVLDALRRRSPKDKPSDSWRLALSGESPTSPAAFGAAVAAAPDLDKEYVEACCRTIVAVAEALHSAHQRGIIHRDVKPGNIFIDRQGRARLGDFGLAAISTQPHVTLSGEFFGTPYYVSPEQARGRHDLVDARSDVYSLGATLYECLTLSPPFEGASTPEVLALILRAEPIPPRKVNRSVPRDLDTIILKAISRNADDRYKTAAAFAEDVQRFLSYQPILARPVRLPVRLLKRIRRKPVHAALVLAACLAAGAVAVGYWAVGAYRQAQEQVRQVEQRVRQTEGQVAAQELYELGKAERLGGVFQGRRMPKDPAKALTHFEAGAKRDHVGAMRELADMYLNGVGTSANAERAAYWAKRALDMGGASCIVLYGRSLLRIPGREEEGLEELAAAATHADYRVRLDAVEALGGLHSNRAAEPLIAALRDAAAAVRSRAAFLLRGCEDGRAIEPLLAALADEDPMVRSHAYGTLGRLGDRCAVERMIVAMTVESRWSVRQSAVSALARIGGKTAFEAVVAALKDKKEFVRSVAAESLAEMDDKRAVEPLIEALGDRYWGVRSAAATALGKLGDEQAVAPLMAALRDRDKIACARAAWALGRLGNQRAAEPLIAAFEAGPDEYVLHAVLLALGDLGGQRAELFLTAKLQDTADRVRRWAALGLAKLRHKRGSRSLIAMLHDPNERVRYEAAWALVEQGDARSITELLALSRDRDRAVRERATRVWRYLRSRGADKLLCRALRDDDQACRRAAAEALGRLGNKEATRALIRALKDRSASVQFVAAWSLVQLRTEWGVTALLAGLKDKDASLRRVAALALGQLRESRAIQPLIPMLSDPSPSVRNAVAQALGALGDDRATEPLTAALRDPNSVVRKAAADALRKLRQKPER